MVSSTSKSELIRAALREIEDREGRITPDGVIRAAKNKNNVLHGEFDWNNTSAGHKWRLEQARELIRGVTVRVTTDKRTISVVSYVRDPEARESRVQGY